MQGQRVWRFGVLTLKTLFRSHQDYHNRAMLNYEPVPKRWYIATLAVSLGAAILLMMFAPLQLPVWGLLIAVVIALTFLIPVGIIKAVSDTSVGLNVITEFVAGKSSDQC